MEQDRTYRPKNTMLKYIYLDHEERRKEATPEDTKREGRRGEHSKGIHRGPDGLRMQGSGDTAKEWQ